MIDYIKSISIEFIAAFLGFLFALLLENVIEKKQKKEKTQLIIKNIVEELTDIQSSLSIYINNKHSLYSLMQTPSWDALQNSGLTIELVELPYYQDLIDSYSLIKSCNDALIIQRVNSVEVERLKEISDSINKLFDSINGG